MFHSYFSDNFAANTVGQTLATTPSPVALQAPPLNVNAVPTAMPVPQTREEWGNLIGDILGPPQPTRPDRDQIVNDIFVQPYRSPFDGIDPYGQETPRMVAHYNTQYRNDPIIRAAVRGKADDICILEPAILAQNRHNPIESKAAEFVKWTIETMPGSWYGLFDSIVTPGIINGWSISEKKRKVVNWNGEWLQGMGHVRNLDTAVIRLQLDVYRNVISVVNMVRGLEYYGPDDVVLYSHNPIYSNPFGQSDIRAATRSADIIQEAYRVWFVAMTVYGLPYMKAKGPAAMKTQLATIMRAMREGGACVLPEDCDVEVLNLAAAAGTTMFESFIHIKREDIFFAIRHVAQPFMEGDGGSDAHTDTDIQQGTSDAGERAISKRLEAVVNEQIIPWLVVPNFGNIAMPRLKLGGTDWKQTKDIVSIFKDAQAIGAKPSAEQFYNAVSIVPARDESDVLMPPQQGGAGGPGGGAPGQGAAPSPQPQGGDAALAHGHAQAKQNPTGPTGHPVQQQQKPAAFSAGYNDDLDSATVARVIDILMAEEMDSQYGAEDEVDRVASEFGLSPYERAELEHRMRS